MKILFVCTGNTCRSPMAKMMLNQKLKRAGIPYIKVFSAGVLSKGGKEIAKESALALKKLGYRKEKHVSSNISRFNLNEYKIFTMTDEHKNVLGNGAQSAKDLLGFDLADPYGGSQEEYDECAKQMEQFVDSVLSNVVTWEVKK